MAPRYRIIDPDSYGILASILALAYPIVGGMGSLWGGLVGGAEVRHGHPHQDHQHVHHDEQLDEREGALPSSCLFAVLH